MSGIRIGEVALSESHVEINSPRWQPSRQGVGAGRKGRRGGGRLAMAPPLVQTIAIHVHHPLQQAPLICSRPRLIAVHIIGVETLLAVSAAAIWDIFRHVWRRDAGEFSVQRYLSLSIGRSEWSFVIFLAQLISTRYQLYLHVSVVFLGNVSKSFLSFLSMALPSPPSVVLRGQILTSCPTRCSLIS